MQLIKIVNAYMAADQMRYAKYYNGQKIIQEERELPFAQAEALVELSAKLKPQYDRYADGEKALINEYAKRDEDGNAFVVDGQVSFETVEDKVSFDNAMKTLQEEEVAVEGLPISMPKPAAVRCSWLEALDGFVVFV